MSMPAGWYEDESGVPRYWDGSSWAEVQDGANAAQSSTSRRIPWPGLIVGGLILVVAIGVAAYLLVSTSTQTYTLTTDPSHGGCQATVSAKFKDVAGMTMDSSDFVGNLESGTSNNHLPATYRVDHIVCIDEATQTGYDASNPPTLASLVSQEIPALRDPSGQVLSSTWACKPDVVARQTAIMCVSVPGGLMHEVEVHAFLLTSDERLVIFAVRMQENASDSDIENAKQMIRTSEITGVY